MLFFAWNNNTQIVKFKLKIDQHVISEVFKTQTIKTADVIPQIVPVLDESGLPKKLKSSIVIDLLVVIITFGFNSTGSNSGTACIHNNLYYKWKREDG